MKFAFSWIIPRGITATIAACGLCLLAQCLAATSAQAQYHVTQDISALSGLGTFYLEFQLSDGAQTGNNTSRADIFSFALTGASLGAVLPPTIGAAQGNLTSTLTLRDSDPSTNGLADFAQGFSVTGGSGSSLSFDLDLSATGFDAPTPDGFFLFILDSGFTSLPTNGSAGTEFLSQEFRNATALSTGPSGFSSAAGTSPFLPAPIIARRTVGNGVAPEPGSLALLLPLAGVAGRVIRKRHRK